MKMESREPVFLGKCFIDDIMLWMLREHKGMNMAWLSFSLFKNSIGTSPSSLKMWWNKNILLTATDIAKNVALGILTTSYATMFFISLKDSLHFPSKTKCTCVPRWMVVLDKLNNDEPRHTCNIYKSAHTWGKNHKPYQQWCRKEEVGQFHWQ
jgi:hypothetical protein